MTRSKPRSGVWVLGLTALLLSVAAVSSSTQAQSGPTGNSSSQVIAGLSVGKAVEVQPEKTWIAATVLRIEPRRVRVRYMLGKSEVEEWISSDRVRLPAAAIAPPVEAAPPRAVPVTPIQAWSIKDKVQVKWQSTWRDAVILEARDKKWYLVNYAPGPYREWVEFYRVREVGSKVDELGTVTPNPQLPEYSTEGPPRQEPGDPQTNAAGSSGSSGSGTATASGQATPEGNVWTSRSESDEPPIVELDSSSISKPMLGGIFNPSLEPDPLPVQESVAGARPVRLGRQGDMGFESGSGEIRFTRTAKRPTAVIVTVGRTAFIDQIDLIKSESLGSAEMPCKTSLWDLSADGSLVLTMSGRFKTNSGQRLDIWRITGREKLRVTHVSSLLPFDFDKSADKSLKWAALVGADDHVLALSRRGSLSCVSLSGKVLWTGQINRESLPALSANHKYLAVCVGDMVAIVDPLTGKTLHTLDATGSPALRLSFRPDGRWLAGVSGDLLLAWNIMEREPAVAASPRGISSSATPCWVADRYVLLDGLWLFGLDQKAVVWRYKRDDSVPIPVPKATEGSFAGRYWYLAPDLREMPPMPKFEPAKIVMGNSNDVRRQMEENRVRRDKMMQEYREAQQKAVSELRGCVLASTVIPEAAARKVIDATPEVEAPMLGPGSKVSLEVNLSPELARRVTESAIPKLIANGLSVEPGQPVKLVASTISGQPVTQEYYPDSLEMQVITDNILGRKTPGLMKGTFTPLSCFWEFQGPGNQSLWRASFLVTPPNSLNLQQGQDLSQALSATIVPNVQFFLSTRFPRYVTQPRNPPGLGESKLNSAGIKLN